MPDYRHEVHIGSLMAITSTDPNPRAHDIAGFEFGVGSVAVYGEASGLLPRKLLHAIYTACGLTALETGSLTGVSTVVVQNDLQRTYTQLRSDEQNIWGNPSAPSDNLARYFIRTGVLRVERSGRTLQINRREYRALQMASYGMSLPSISQQLGLSPNTVGTQLQRMYERNGVHSKAEAIMTGVVAGNIPIHADRTVLSVEPSDDRRLLAY